MNCRLDLLILYDVGILPSGQIVALVELLIEVNTMQSSLFDSLQDIERAKP